jgi:hypothetical protein
MTCLVVLILVGLGLLSLIAATQPYQESPLWGTRGELWDPSGPLKDLSAWVGRGGTDHSPHLGPCEVRPHGAIGTPHRGALRGLPPHVR